MKRFFLLSLTLALAGIWTISGADDNPSNILKSSPDVIQAREFALPEKAPYTGPINVPDQNVILQGGDRCEDATLIPAIPYTDNGTTSGYSDDYDEVCPYAGSTSPDVVYAYMPEVDIDVDITLCTGQTDYDTKLYIYEDVCQEPNDGQDPYSCNDDACSSPYNFVSELYCLPMFAGHTYYIVIDGYGGASGDYTIDITECVPPSGACCVGIDCVATNTEAECANMGGNWYEGQTCPEFQCPVAPCTGETVVYRNAGPYDDYGSPFSQYAIDYPFACGAADDVTPDEPLTIDMVETWTTHWHGAHGLGPNVYAGVNITFYFNYFHPDAGYDMPDGYLQDDGTRVPYDVGWLSTQFIPIGAIAFAPDHGCTGDRWHLLIPIEPVGLDACVKYWLEIQPVMNFNAPGGQAAVQIGDANTGDGAEQIFVLLGLDPWNPIDGNANSCPDTEPAGTFRDLAFCLHGTAGIPLGACCDEGDTGDCVDALTEAACDALGYPRWVQCTSCEDLEPTCAAATGACCDEGVTGDCQDGATLAECEDAGYARWEEEVLCEVLEPPCEGGETQTWTVQQEYKNLNEYGFVAQRLRKVFKGKVDVVDMITNPFTSAKATYSQQRDQTVIVWDGADIPHGETAWACFSTKNGKKAKPTEVKWYRFDRFPPGLLLIRKWDAGQPIGGGGDDADKTTSLSIEVSNDWYSDSLGSDIITGSEVYWAEVPNEYSLDELNESLFDDPSISWESLPGFELAYESDSLYTFDDLTDDYYVLFRFLAEGTFDIPPVTELWQIPTTMARGACCDYSTGECENDILQSECDGRFATNMLCSELDPPCGEAVGACCFDDGGCEELTAVACTDQGGYFLGAFISCDPINPCWQPTPICMENSLFDQPPAEWLGGWNAVDSDIGGPYTVYEDFAVEDDFYRIRFWGISLSDLSEECVEEPMTFEIKFYPDDGFGYPDLANPACTTYTPELWGTPTGLLYGDFMLYEWEVDLYEACSLGAGWISIRGISIGEPTDCQFLWMSHNEAGDGFCYQHQGESFVSYDFDVSLCLSVDCGGGQKGQEFDGFQQAESAGGITTFHLRIKGGKPGQMILVIWEKRPPGDIVEFWHHTLDENGELSKDAIAGVVANVGDTDNLRLIACGGEVDVQPGRWVAGNSTIRVPYDCVYIVGDCNHNGVALELGDVIAVVAYYRGQQTPAYTCDCPPHGANFTPDADPNSNCTAFELADVVAEIAFYRGQQTPGAGCIDCPAPGRIGPGGEGTTVIPSLKSKVKINKGDLQE